MASSSLVSAQESILFQDSRSPLETDWQEASVRPEVTTRDALLSNPALLRGTLEQRSLFYNDNPKASHQSFPLTVAINGATGRMKGDYIPINGNSFDDYSILANGIMKGEKSLFYGKASFTAGTHRNIGWNTLRFPETYFPYVVADSTGGNMSYETYNLLCAYSFQLNQHLDLGVSGEYKGDFAFRKTDPRIEDVTSWLTLKGGAAYTLPGGDRIGLNVEYQLHRQHSSVKHFRSGQFAGFFMEYGFGMFDYIHSPIYNSMKNQQHQHSCGIAAQYTGSSQRALRLNARLAYGMDIMNSEENIYKLNLYRATTNKLRLNLSALWNNDSWGAAFYANGLLSQRKGREFIFERYVSSTVDGVDIYDYRKIGHQDRYTLRHMEGNAQVKLSKYLGNTTTLSLIGGAALYHREESYKTTSYKIQNALLTPQVGIEAQHTAQGTLLRLTAKYGKRTSLRDKYNVNVDLDRHTEYQHAFSNYAYYAHEGNVVQVEGEVSHTFNTFRLGVLAQLLLVDAKRIDGAVYDSNRYHESVPYTHKYTPSLSPDRHDQHWAKLTIYAEF